MNKVSVLIIDDNKPFCMSLQKDIDETTDLEKLKLLVALQ